MLQLTRRYLRQIDGIFLALCAACSVLSVVTLVSIGHNQLGSINKASVQFIASALGILLALIVSTVDYRALAHAWPFIQSGKYFIFGADGYTQMFPVFCYMLEYVKGGTPHLDL